jgi:hypothetical protein
MEHTFIYTISFLEGLKIDQDLINTESHQIYYHSQSSWVKSMINVILSSCIHLNAHLGNVVNCTKGVIFTGTPTNTSV